MTKPIDAEAIKAMAEGTWIPPVKRMPLQTDDALADYRNLVHHHEAESKALMAAIAELAKRLVRIEEIVSNVPTPDLDKFGDEWAMRCDHLSVQIGGVVAGREGKST